MGGCISSPRSGSRNGESNSEVQNRLVGRNQALKVDKHRWTTESPFSKKELDSKRDEFWDTAPAYDGRKEIWDALKAAANALESGDTQLAQAIIDGASISLPTGTLFECYDELGTHYSLPRFAVLPPQNLQLHESPLKTPPMPPKSSTTIVKFRLSIGRDVKLTIRTSDTVGAIKQQLSKQEGIAVDKQRWFFAGRLLHDRMRLEEAKIPKGFVVQVIINEI